MTQCGDAAPCAARSASVRWPRVARGRPRERSAGGCFLWLACHARTARRHERHDALLPRSICAMRTW